MMGKETGVGRREGKILKVKHNRLKLFARRKTQREEHWHFVKARKQKLLCKGTTLSKRKEEEDHKCHSFVPTSNKCIPKAVNKLSGVYFLVSAPISYTVLPSLRSRRQDWRSAAAAAPARVCVCSDVPHPCLNAQIPPGLQLGDANAPC